MAISAYGLRPSPPTHTASSRGNPVNAMALLRNDAPARMNMIMHETRVVPSRLSTKFDHVRDPPHHAIAREPRTPYAAHSVAVASPASNTYRMNRISNVHGISSRDLRIFSRSD